MGSHEQVRAMQSEKANEDILELGTDIDIKSLLL